jgi:predicted TIM-barrel fold metal-dependent hydrolase
MKVDFEAHFYTRSYLKALLERDLPPKFEYDSRGRIVLVYPEGFRMARYVDRFIDFDARVDDMDRAGVNVQILSIARPGTDRFDSKYGLKLAMEINDAIARISEKYEDRFLGLASLPKDPEMAVEEMERAIKDLGIVGINLHSNIDGKPLDALEFLPIYEKAEQMRIPVFIHPTLPVVSEAVKDYGLWGAALGYTFDGALAALRLILSGVLDTYPSLKVVLPHLGETLPYLFKRIDSAGSTIRKKGPASARLGGGLEPKNSMLPSQYLLRNFYVDSAGILHSHAFICAYNTLGAERILFATDYPFEDMEEASQFIENLEIPEKDKKKIFYRNFENLTGKKLH